MNRRRMIACAGAAALALCLPASHAQEPPAASDAVDPDHARRRPPRGDLRRPRRGHPEEHAAGEAAAGGLARLQALLGGDAGRAAPQAAAVLLAAGHRAGIDRRQPRARQRRAAVQQEVVLVSRLRGDPARARRSTREITLERSDPQPARDRARAAAPRAEADAGAGRDVRQLGRLQRHRRAHRGRDDDQRRRRAAGHPRRRHRAAEPAAARGRVRPGTTRGSTRSPFRPAMAYLAARAAARALPVVQRHRQLGARGPLRSAARRLRPLRPVARAVCGRGCSRSRTIAAARTC